jgi:para-aminobenzoate synthetase component 1
MDLVPLVRYLADRGNVILLESQSSDHPWSRKSYLAALPEAEIVARDDHITITQNGHERHETGNPWEWLHTFRAEQEGWLVGYLGYDLKNHIEDLHSQNPDPISAPDLFFMNPGLLIEIDAASNTIDVIQGKIPHECEYSQYHEGNSNFVLDDFYPVVPRDDYLDRIDQIQQGIFEGTYYEVNLSHQMKGVFEGDTLALYQRMKKIGPVPFGAYMKLADLTICCQSPERFLAKEGATVFSQPIKGTARRGSNLDEDKVIKNQLSSSAKERAENLMIVDLVRNDLSRIARRGSVKVPKLFSIESFGTVHQMVSTITAQAEETNPLEILKACFPMGSMTGAPKISAMEAIEQLEDYRRGIYSGAIGYITPGGDFDFNVVIRTAQIRNNNLFYSVGGAITGDSDPQHEWDETLIKARALVDTLDQEKISG